MPRRGFSLVEILIAVLLIAAVSGLALPRLFARVGEAEVESVASQLRASATIARTDAKSAGVATRLTLHQDRDGRLHLRAEPHESAELPEPDQDGDEADDTLLWPRLYLSLPPAWRIAQDDEDPGAQPFGEADAAGRALFEPVQAPRASAGSADGEGVTIGLLLPDGTAIPGRPITLASDRHADRLIRLSLRRADARLDVAVTSAEQHNAPREAAQRQDMAPPPPRAPGPAPARGEPLGQGGRP